MTLTRRAIEAIAPDQGALSAASALLEPELLAAVEADVNLVASLMSLRNVMPEKTKDTARQVIAKVVAS